VGRPDALTGNDDATVAPPEPKTRSSRSRLRAPMEDESSVDFAAEEGLSVDFKDDGAAAGRAAAAGGVGGPRDEADADWS
jgi:hypothetical protein